MRLEVDAIDEVAADESSSAAGIVFVVVAGLAMAMGTLVLVPGVVVFPIVLLIEALVVGGILHLIATVGFKGNSDFVRFFRVYCATYVLRWVTVVPLLGPMIAWLAWLWQMVTTAFVVERVYGLERGRAFATVGILVGIGVVFIAVFGSLAAIFWLVAAS